MSFNGSDSRGSQYLDAANDSCFRSDHGEITYLGREGCLYELPRPISSAQEYVSLLNIVKKMLNKKTVLVKKIDGSVIFNPEQAIGEIRFVLPPDVSLLLNHNKYHLLGILDDIRSA